MTYDAGLDVLLPVVHIATQDVEQPRLREVTCESCGDPAGVEETSSRLRVMRPTVGHRVQVERDGVRRYRAELVCEGS